MSWSERRLLLVGGKGGVGKSTVSCALAVHAARSGLRTVLLSTDPAHSIRDVLGPGDWPDLMLEALDADSLVEAFRAEHHHTLAEIALRGTVLDARHVESLLEQGLPGQDELMALLRLSRLLGDPDVDKIIVDTAPTGHTLRLLDQPTLLMDWLDALDTLIDKHRYLRSRFGGGAGPDHLDTFIARHREIAQGVQAALHDDQQCGFVVVTLPEQVVWAETANLVQALQDRGIPRAAVVVNRWRGTTPAALRDLPDSIVLPESEDEPLGPLGVAALWSLRHDLPSEDDRTVASPILPRAAGPLPAQVLDRPWIWLAGKGGVGKTTLACAIALSLAEAHPGRRILLLSTDPAHSLGAALDLAVGADPTPVHKGLHAAAIDAAAELDFLRTEYAEDVSALFGATLSGIDPVFDRAVLERLLDLAPPGIDEVMALARAARLASEGGWDHVVVDTAPTGHFLRLLGLPQILAAWIRWAFDVLLDHKDVLRLPRLSAELVRRNREIKAFRKLLGDSDQSALVVVRRPTEVTRAETAALLKAARAAGLPATALIDNLAPAGAVVHDEDGLLVVPISSAAPPVGVQALASLGHTLQPAHATREVG